MKDPLEKMAKDLQSQKKFKSALITAGDDHHLRIDKLSFDVLLLDELLSGGLPFGRMSLIYGDCSVGKTFLAQKLAVSAQKREKLVAHIDIDKTFEPDWWRNVGVDTSNLLVVRPNTGEQAFDVALALVESKIDLVVMDSLDALLPTAEAEASMEENFIGLQARLIASGLRKILKANEKTIFLCLNHIREGVGRFAQLRIPGGKAQEDFSSVMLWITKGGIIKEDEVKRGGDPKRKAGFKMRITVEKDKIHGKMYESCELPFLFEGGVLDTVSGLVELCLDSGIVVKQGPWYEFAGQKLLGKLAVKEYLLKNEDVQEELRKQIQEIKQEKYT